jgi:hypothetical protein
MRVSFATIGSMSVGSISTIIVVSRAAISAMGVSSAAVGVGRATVGTMNIGRASAGVSRAAIASISIAGTWSGIISTRTRCYINCWWGSNIDRRGWGYINCRRPDYHHTTCSCKKPRTGRP